MTHRPCASDSTGRTYTPLIGVKTSGAMVVAPNTVRPTRMMDASLPTPREGESAVGRTAFAKYLQKIAVAEVERASGELQSEAYAIANPEKPQVRSEPSIDELYARLEDVECAVRFFQLAKELEGAE